MVSFSEETSTTITYTGSEISRGKTGTFGAGLFGRGKFGRTSVTPPNPYTGESSLTISYSEE